MSRNQWNWRQNNRKKWQKRADFENINKIDKTLERLTKKKIKKIQIINIRYETGGFTLDSKYQKCKTRILAITLQT